MAKVVFYGKNCCSGHACPLLFLLFLSLFHMAVFADDPELLPVLILHSYHPGFIWTDGVMEGMRTGLSKHTKHLDLQVEYLDAKRFPQVSVQGRFLDLLGEKTRDRMYAVVLVSDNIGLATATRAKGVLCAL
ncbi:MAG: hypothetical protein EHM28_13825 [Spirochaetaceae bacterium]|nr:MAG: hypothetical protein EHM28_13825 [Spirochaetaceae bacterium]